MKYPFHGDANSRLFGFAKRLRKEQTKGEEVLWAHLRRRQLLGKKFRRQHPFAGYILDFYCHECQLVVEVDGLIHKINDNPAYDKERTAFLNAQGMQVLRFSNHEVIHELTKVLESLRKYISSLPSPPRRGAGGEGVEAKGVEDERVEDERE